MITSQDLLAKGFAAISCVRFHAGYPNGLELESDRVIVKTQKDLDLIFRLIATFKLDIETVVFKGDFIKIKHSVFGITSRFFTSAFIDNKFRFGTDNVEELSEFGNSKILNRTKDWPHKTIAKYAHRQGRVTILVRVGGESFGFQVKHTDGRVDNVFGTDGANRHRINFTYFEGGASMKRDGKCTELKAFEVEGA